MVDLCRNPHFFFNDLYEIFWTILFGRRYSKAFYLEEYILRHSIILVFVSFFSNSEYSKLFFQYFAPFLRQMVFSLSLSEVRMRINAFSHGLTALCHASLSIFSFFTWTCTMIWEGKPQAQVSFFFYQGPDMSIP